MLRSIWSCLYYLFFLSFVYLVLAFESRQCSEAVDLFHMNSGSKQILYYKREIVPLCFITCLMYLNQHLSKDSDRIIRKNEEEHERKKAKSRKLSKTNTLRVAAINKPKNVFFIYRLTFFSSRYHYAIQSLPVIMNGAWGCFEAENSSHKLFGMSWVIRCTSFFYAAWIIEHCLNFHYPIVITCLYAFCYPPFFSAARF